MRYLFSFLFSCFFIISNAQTRIDGVVDFQTNPEKQYSIYIPSNYDENIPSKMMVGLHPLNTSRWNSISWCDTLIAFAESNNLLMICPNGGIDGMIDDPIDTAFTTFIIDSMLLWYNVDEAKIFAMGFSWGGRTTYSYGLNHVDRFAGFMPIGAAVTDTDQVDGVLENAKDKPFYIIHGSIDSPNTRFFPIRDALIDEEACVETNVLSGVGHTIDFPNRNTILTTGFMWLDSVSCGLTNTIKSPTLSETTKIFPNPAQLGDLIKIDIEGNIIPIELRVYDSAGKEVLFVKNTNQINTKNLEKGIFILKIKTGSQQFSTKLILH